MPSELARLLKQRGHHVTREGSRAEIFLPDTDDSVILGAFEEILYAMLKRDGFRKSLRNWSNDRPALCESHQHQIDSYMTLCRAHSTKGKDPTKDKRQRYSTTFEWYISELLRREFAARASGFAIRLQDAHVDDEFDVIAVIDKGIIYVECKTGQDQVYDGIEKFSRRDIEIRGDYSLYIFDRDYVFQKSNDDMPNITRTQAGKFGISSAYKVTTPQSAHEFFVVEGRYNVYFFACSTAGSLENKIRHTLRYTNSTPMNFFPAPTTAAGYEHTEVSFSAEVVEPPPR